MKENERKKTTNIFNRQNNPLPVPTETEHGFNRNGKHPWSGWNPETEFELTPAGFWVKAPASLPIPMWLGSWTHFTSTDPQKYLVVWQFLDVATTSNGRNSPQVWRRGMEKVTSWQKAWSTGADSPSPLGWHLPGQVCPPTPHLWLRLLDGVGIR